MSSISDDRLRRLLEHCSTKSTFVGVKKASYSSQLTTAQICIWPLITFFLLLICVSLVGFPPIFMDTKSEGIVYVTIMAFLIALLGGLLEHLCVSGSFRGMSHVLEKATQRVNTHREKLVQQAKSGASVPNVGNSGSWTPPSPTTLPPASWMAGINPELEMSWLYKCMENLLTEELSEESPVMLRWLVPTCGKLLEALHHFDFFFVQMAAALTASEVNGAPRDEEGRSVLEARFASSFGGGMVRGSRLLGGHRVREQAFVTPALPAEEPVKVPSQLPSVALPTSPSPQRIGRGAEDPFNLPKLKKQSSMEPQPAEGNVFPVLKLEIPAGTQQEVDFTLPSAAAMPPMVPPVNQLGEKPLDPIGLSELFVVDRYPASSSSLTVASQKKALPSGEGDSAAVHQPSSAGKSAAVRIGGTLKPEEGEGAAGKQLGAVPSSRLTLFRGDRFLTDSSNVFFFVLYSRVCLNTSGGGATTSPRTVSSSVVLFEALPESPPQSLRFALAPPTPGATLCPPKPGKAAASGVPFRAFVINQALKRRRQLTVDEEELLGLNCVSKEVSEDSKEKNLSEPSPAPSTSKDLGDSFVLTWNAAKDRPMRLAFLDVELHTRQEAAASSGELATVPVLESEVNQVVSVLLSAAVVVDDKTNKLISVSLRGYSIEASIGSSEDTDSWASDDKMNEPAAESHSRMMIGMSLQEDIPC